jgi:acyl carrier protein phosphodiesterase
VLANLFMHYAFDWWLEREFPTTDFERYADDAVVKDALKRMSEEVRSWHIHTRSGTELEDIAAWVNPIVRGWMTYYGKFYRTTLNRLLQRINTYLARWAKRKYKRLRTFKKVRKWWQGLTERQPRLFAHWAWMTDFRYSL